MSAVVDFCGDSMRLRRGYLGVPGVEEGHGSRRGAVGRAGHSV